MLIPAQAPGKRALRGQSGRGKINLWFRSYCQRVIIRMRCHQRYDAFQRKRNGCLLKRRQGTEGIDERLLKR